ncbi:membrane protein [Streptococcus phocae subsp. salmonis]|nr:membrane protein [Streptococcus phocae subsp. salmonis]
MQRSIFGVFTAFLCAICILCAIPAFKKNRPGLGLLFLLNAFTNLVNTIHAFYGTLF